MSVILITGASGMIGGELLGTLAADGREIHALCRKSPADAQAGPVRWHERDLLSSEGIRELLEDIRPDGLCHLAWTSTPGSSNDPVNLNWLEASRRLLDDFRELGGRRAMVAGTCFEYRWGDEPCSEERTPLEPTTLYGKCKRDLFLHLDGAGCDGDFSWAWPRIFFAYGNREHPDRLVPSIVRSMLAGKPAECTHGRQIRDYLHASDIASGLGALFESGLTGACNIAAGEPVTLARIGEEIAALIGRPELLALGARTAPPGEPALIAADVSRAEKHLDWKPSLTLREGLEQVIAYWRQQEA